MKGILLIVLFCAFCTAAFAENATHEVRLKDGTVVKGVMMVEMDDVIMLRTVDGVKKYLMKDIRKISKIVAQAVPAAPGAPAQPGALQRLDPLRVLDEITLKDGTVVKGKITIKTDTVVLMTTFDGTPKRFATADIEATRAVTKEMLREMYEKKKGAIGKGEYGRHLQLARWCFANDLHEGNEQLKAVAQSDNKADLTGALKVALEERDLPFAGIVASESVRKFPDEEVFKRIEKNLKHLAVSVKTEKDLIRKRDALAKSVSKGQATVKALKAKIAKPFEIYYEEKTEVVKCTKCGGDGVVDVIPRGKTVGTRINCPTCKGGTRKKVITKKIEKKRKLDLTAEKEQLKELLPELSRDVKALSAAKSSLKKVTFQVKDTRQKIYAEIDTLQP